MTTEHDILSALLGAQGYIVDALGTIARDQTALRTDIDGMARAVVEALGRIEALGAAESSDRQRLHADIDLAVSEMRRLGQRAAQLESRVAGIEMAMDAR